MNYIDFIISLGCLYLGINVVTRTNFKVILKKDKMRKELLPLLCSFFLVYFLMDRTFSRINPEFTNLYIYMYIGCFVLFSIIHLIAYKKNKSS